MDVTSEAPDARSDFRTASRREDSAIEGFHGVCPFAVVLEILPLDVDEVEEHARVPEDLETMAGLDSMGQSVSVEAFLFVLFL